MRPSPISPTIDHDRDGVQHGFLKLPYSRDDSAWGAVMIPIDGILAGRHFPGLFWRDAIQLIGLGVDQIEAALGIGFNAHERTGADLEVKPVTQCSIIPGKPQDAAQRVVRDEEHITEQNQSRGPGHTVTVSALAEYAAIDEGHRNGLWNHEVVGRTAISVVLPQRTQGFAALARFLRVEHQNSVVSRIGDVEPA